MKLVRGDTAKFKFQRKDKNGEVIKTKAEKVFFSVKGNTTTKNLILQKTLDNGITFDNDFYYHITINPEDTDSLFYDTYKYDIEVITSDYTKTIKLGDFIIADEVTHAENEV